MQRIRCWRCAETQAPAFFCASCGAVQPLPADVDLFVALGFASHPAIDVKALEARYYELSRRLHPDRFQTASPEEQKASVQATALLNSAFQALRTTGGRGRYWLKRLGEELGKENQQVPPELAALVFDVQERLAEIRTAADKASGRLEVEAMASDVGRRIAAADEKLEQIFRAWPQSNGGADTRPASSSIAELKRVLAEAAYLRTLERDLRAAGED